MKIDMIKILLTLCVVAVYGASNASASTWWIDGNGGSCRNACSSAGMEALYSSTYSNHEKFYMCRAVAAGQGKRPGFNLKPHWSHSCTIAQGGEEVGVNPFECLCKK